MEAAVSTNTTAEPLSIVEQLKNYADSNKISISVLAKETGLGRSTISKYVNGAYGSDTANVDKRVAQFLSKHTGNIINLPTAAVPKTSQKPRFYESRDAKAVLGVCQSCQEYASMGVVIARSGRGKTYSLREYAKLPRVAYIECGGSMCRSDIVHSIENALGLPRGRGTVWQREEAIFEFLNYNKGYLLIIDEADKLINNGKFSKIELLREIFDHYNVGMVFAGEPEMTVQIQTYFDRMENRIVFQAELKGLLPSEVEEYLSDFDITPEAMTEFKERACGMRRSCFRLLDHTLSNVQRILEGSADQTITARVLEQASAMMML